MASCDRVTPRYTLFFIFLLGLLSISLSGFQHKNYITPDSLSYFRAASNLVNKGVFGDDYLLWPPLYPMLLSLHFYVGLDINTFASILNKILFVVTIIGLSIIGAKQLSSKILLGILLTMAALSEPFQLILAFSWSETLYLPLCVLATHFWITFLTEKNKVYLFTAYTLLSLSILTRNVGISLFGTMLLSLITSRNFRFTEKARLVSFMTLAVMPYALWLIRTWLISGHFSGPHHAPAAYIDCHFLIASFGNVIAFWVFPLFRFESLGLLVAVLTAVSLAALAMFSFRRIRAQSPRNGSEATPYKSQLQFFLVIYIFCHSLVVLIAGYTIAVDPPNNRLLSPIYWAVLILAVSMFENARNYLDINRYKRRKRAFEYLGLAYAVMWICAPNPLTDLAISVANNFAIGR